MSSMLIATTAVEVALNKWLFSATNDRQVQQARHQLAGKALLVELREFSHPVTLIFSQHQLDVLSEWQGDIDCTLKSSFSELLKLHYNHNVASLIRQHELDVIGDIKILQHLINLVELVDWRFADVLSPYFGDILAYGAERQLNAINSFICQTAQRQKQSLHIVAKEAWFQLPTPLAFTYLSDQIAMLAQDVEAIANRVEKLNLNDDAN